MSGTQPPSVGQSLKGIYKAAFSRTQSNQNKSGKKVHKKGARNARLFVFLSIATAGLANIPMAIYLKSVQGNSQKKLVLKQKVSQAADTLAQRYHMTSQYCRDKMYEALHLQSFDDDHWDNETTANVNGWNNFVESEGFDEIMSRFVK